LLKSCANSLLAVAETQKKVLKSALAKYPS
jgi:hypothetical protein